jgi:alcohol dehydrogenase class IV
LRDIGVTPDTFELIAEKTIVDGTAAYNPREETIEGVIEILTKAY